MGLAGLSTVSFADGTEVAKLPTAQPVILELYTSQGCSSCPPADEYLRQLVSRDNVVPLSFHVNYWDYIGWPDPFAKDEHTQRQRAYSRHFNLRYVYTPQMVVQGAFQVTGSNRGDVDKAISQAKELPQIPVNATLTAAGKLDIAIGGVQTHERARVWGIAYDKGHTTEILRGENRGRTITYANVVRQLVDLGRWDGPERTFTVNANQFNWVEQDGIVIIVQTERDGRIVGTAHVPLTSAQTAMGQ